MPEPRICIDTAKVAAKDLQPGWFIVGDQGGLACITGEVYKSATMRGSTAVEIEHGTLYLDEDEPVTVAHKLPELPETDEVNGGGVTPVIEVNGGVAEVTSGFAVIIDWDNVPNDIGNASDVLDGLADTDGIDPIVAARVRDTIITIWPALEIEGDPDEADCRTCGCPMVTTEVGVTHHLTDEGGIDHDADADHTPIPDTED